MNATWQALLESIDETVRALPTDRANELYQRAEAVATDHPGLLETRDPAALMLRALMGLDWT